MNPKQRLKEMVDAAKIVINTDVIKQAKQKRVMEEARRAAKTREEQTEK